MLSLLGKPPPSLPSSTFRAQFMEELTPQVGISEPGMPQTRSVKFVFVPNFEGEILTSGVSSPMK